MQKIIASLTQRPKYSKLFLHTLVYGNRNENTTHNFIHDDRAKTKRSPSFLRTWTKGLFFAARFDVTTGCGCEARVGLGIAKTDI